MNDLETVEAALHEVEGPLTIQELAGVTGLQARDVDRVVWGSPDRFAWQPGHRWSLTARKSRPAARFSKDIQEARTGATLGAASGELRAITLSSGLTIKVSRRPLDSDAFFSVRSAGNLLELILNSTHEIFGELPMPFRDDVPDGGSQRLLEVLLQAWALYEDSIPGGPARRATQDARLLWGRRALEILRDSE